MLANTTYPSLSGTSVYWVELPSQVMENWCYEPELWLCLQHIIKRAKSYRWKLKIKESSNFQEGMATMRQLSFGLLDMGWHGQDPSAITDIKAFEIEQFAATKLYPEVKENA
jgi:peptidyl-dipeptidase Dcp